MHYSAFINYILESAICITVLYLVYLVFFQRLTYFKWNRIYLLSTLLFGFLLPALNVSIEGKQTSLETFWNEKVYVDIAEYNNAQKGNNESIPTLQNEQNNQLKEELKQVSEPLFFADWSVLIILIYLTGVIFSLGKLLLAAWQIQKLIKKYPIQNKGIYSWVKVPENFTSFSFFKWVFLPADKINNKQILKHELIHVVQMHSVDILLVELVIVFQWFNPALYLLKKSLRQTHEYLADNGASGNKPKKYAQLLLSNATHYSKFTLTNSFAFLPLKKRIVMLTKKKSSGNSRWKYTLSLPVFLSLFMVFSCTDEKDVLEEAFLNGAGIKSVKVIYEDQYGDSPNRNGKVIDMIQLGLDGKLVEPELEVSNFYSRYLMREQDALEFDLSQNKEIVWILDDNVAFGNVLALHSEHLPRYILTFDEEWLRMKNYAGGKAIYKNTVGSDSKFQINGDGLPTELKTYSGDERLLEKQSFQYGSNGKLSQAYYEVHPLNRYNFKIEIFKDTYSFSYNPEDHIEYYYKDNLAAKLIYDGDRVVEKHHYKDGQLINRLKFEYEAGFRTKALAYNKENTLEYTLDYQYEFYN